MVAALEIFSRVYELDKPELRAPTLLCESAGLHEADQELFWALRPNLLLDFQGVRVVTNSLGLRSAEIDTKEPNEFRILSLGESTTFGAGVENDETYSALLETYLNQADRTRKYRVINAGVSAYTSFQSLKYLEFRGLQLRPDMVLFYHEYNDSLRTVLRDGGPKDEAALAATDKQLYFSRKNRMHRILLSHSGIYRFITYHAAREQITKQSDSSDSVFEEGGSRVETRLPVRVPLEERKEILGELLAVCQSRGLQLVMIHPSYRDFARHECELTEFCQQHNVPMFDAYGSLHGEESNPDGLFLDGMHPNRQGHRLLATDLLGFLSEARLVPFAR